MKRIAYIVAFVFLSFNYLFCQVNHEREINWQEQLTQYKDELIQRDPSGIDDLNRLTNKWEGTDATDEDLDRFINWLYHYITDGRKADSTIISRIELLAPHSNLSMQLKEEDVQILRSHVELFKLIQKHLAEARYPFKIRSDSRTMKELNEYHIKQGDSIGFIAFDKEYLLLLKELSPDNDLYFTEINYTHSLDMTMNLDIQNDRGNAHMSKNEFSLGQVRATNLDKIIVRRAFHHFENQDAFLKSMNGALKRGGKLLLLEPVKRLLKKKGECDKALKKKKLLRILKAHEFKLIEEVDFGDEILFKYENI